MGRLCQTGSRQILAHGEALIGGALGESSRTDTFVRPMAGGPHAQVAWGARRLGRSAFYLDLVF
jgi:hypothetical protein